MSWSCVNGGKKLIYEICTEKSQPWPTTTTSYEFIGDLFNPECEALFVDGSRYQGTWDSLGMAGAGSFVMPNGVTYHGEIRDGMQHGKGSLEYPGKQVINGVWNRGELQKLRYTFSDGLTFENEEWNYCQFPDRRFYRSVTKGLKPAGRSFKTQYQPTKVIPLGCYDSGDGIFDPSTLCVTNFEHPSKIVRIPSAEEAEWIIKRCRKGGTEPTGYRHWINENWALDRPKLPYRLAMSNDSPDRWWKRISTFEKDSDAVIANGVRRGLDKFEDYSDQRSERRTIGCFCGAEGRRETQETGHDVGEGDELPGEQNSDKETDYLREVFCEGINYYRREYQGEDEENLLMTVCCPPEDRIMIRRRRGSESVTSLDSGKETEDKEEEEEEENEENEEEEEVKKEEEEEEEEREEEEEEEEEEYESLEELETEEFLDYWKVEKQLEDSYDSIIDVEEETERVSTDSGDFFAGEILREKSVRGESNLGSLIRRISKDSNKPMQAKQIRVLEKRKPEGAKRKVAPKYQKKLPCPVVDDAEQLLQRKVGDLLFSPALEAPRSPVYLVRKECDKNICGEFKPARYDASICGVSPANYQEEKKKKKNKKKEKQKKTTKRSVSKGDGNLKDNLDSINRNICVSSKPFITM